MRKILRIALREFLATAGTKGFVIGLVVPLAIMGIMALILPRMLHQKPPRVEGEVAVIDPTGRVAAGLRTWLTPEAMSSRHARDVERVAEATPEAVRQLAGDEASMQAALQAALGEIPRIDVVELPATADVEREKAPLRSGDGKSGGRLALVQVHADAVVRSPGQKEFGTFDLFVHAKLDDRVDDEIRDGLREAIVDARIAAAGHDQAEIRALTRLPRVRSVGVTGAGESGATRVFNALLPAGMGVLLLMSAMIGGQSLMTTTIEEKSSRVAEVLLSAVSPMELMTGKILGQMCVGLLILGVYGGLGVVGLLSFALLGLVEPMLLVYLLIFFLITYFVMAALMGAIGAAVNELREAQTLLTPVMMLMMLPWFLWMPISRNPDSGLSVAMSFLPPVNSFAMLLRMTSVSPPPTWQVWLSIAVGIASVYAALWFAGKVFRVGLLMYGKPPNLVTLIRWVRMA